MATLSIVDPKQIRYILQKDVVQAPGTWREYLSIGESLGAKILPIRMIPFAVDIGDSPGSTWAWEGEIYIERSCDPECTVFHEVCHWMVSKLLDKQLQINFGSNTDDEIDTCDAQITWLLVNRGPKMAHEVAMFLQYNQAGEKDTVQRTLDRGQDLWAASGMPLEVTPEMAQDLARYIDPCWTPDQSWAGPPYGYVA